MTPLAQRLKAAARLPTPPGAALRILELTRKSDASMAEVADTLAADPALSVRLLKYANSALVGARREITTVREATVLLGMRTVRMMALSFSLVSSQDRRACPGFDYGAFWSHSLAHAVAARNLAHKHRSVPGEEAFAAGLLAGIGKLTFAVTVPQEYAEILARTGGAYHATTELERQRFGGDFREAGAMVLTHWGIPNRLALAVRHQCDPNNVVLPEFVKPVASIIHEARPYARLVRSTDPLDDETAPPRITQTDGITRTLNADEIAMVEAMRGEYATFASTLAIEGGQDADIDRIQSEASEALGELSLSAATENDADVPAETRPPEPRSRDTLTGVANRAGFERQLEHILQRGLETGQPIAVAIIDIDQFKAFNDAQGHQTGDAVLQSLARVIRSRLRQVDVVARIRGEEFAIVLPNADRFVAAGICVGIRRAIETDGLEHDGTAWRLTISVGAALLVKPASCYTGRMLLEIAEQQLQKSKQKGRNCCSMRQLPAVPDESVLAAVMAS